MAMATILLIAAVAACCGLCAYGISRSVRRSRERRAQNAKGTPQEHGITPGLSAWAHTRRTREAT